MLAKAVSSISCGPYKSSGTQAKACAPSSRARATCPRALANTVCRANHCAVNKRCCTSPLAGKKRLKWPSKSSAACSWQPNINAQLYKMIRRGELYSRLSGKMRFQRSNCTTFCSESSCSSERFCTRLATTSGRSASSACSTASSTWPCCINHWHARKYTCLGLSSASSLCLLRSKSLNKWW